MQRFSTRLTLHRIRNAALRVKLRTIFIIGAVGLPVALLLVAGLVAQQTERSNEATQTLQRLMAANGQPRALFTLLQDAESGQRGFLLTGQARYLKPYAKALAQAPEALQRLDELVAQSPSSAVEVSALRDAARAKLDELTKTISLSQAGRQDEALALVSWGWGQDVMDEIRQRLIGLRAPLSERIAAQMAEQKQTERHAYELIGALLMVIVVFSLFSAVMILINLKDRERIIAEKDRTEIERASLMEQLEAERQRLVSTVRQLGTAKRLADEANMAKSEFLASMSHELRTPLNAILGFSEVIRDELYGPIGLPKYVDYANDVHTSGQHLLDLINDVLDLSKIDAGKVEMREENVGIADLIEDCVVLVQERARKANVTLEVRMPDDTLAARADTRLLKQILLNLLTNAIKFTPEGGSVSISAEAGESGLAIAVIDTGIGMNADEIKKAMSVYGQIDSHISRKHEGTGLGLPISRGLAELHGGSLAVESTPGKGTNIRLLLPAERVVTRARLSQSA